MQTLVAEVLEDLKTERVNRNIRFKIDVRGNCITDRPLLRQAISNLLQNAIKFTRCRNPANIAICGGDSAVGYEFSIVDNGIGFDPAQSHRLFKLFQRLYSGGDIEGVGVGLAVIRRIVESLGGDVSATPVAPHGARFVLKLPKMQVAP